MKVEMSLNSRLAKGPLPRVRRLKGNGNRAHPMLAKTLISISWIAACLTGTYWAVGYEFKAGLLGPRMERWPLESETLTRPRVMAFLHPRCVCTGATVKQLVNVFQADPDAQLILVVFTPPDGAQEEGSDYVKTIQAAVPDVKIVWDRGGMEARRFGAPTSGTILVYDAQAREVFRGGITDRRGGEGDNPGLQRLARILKGGAAEADSSPVFGCPIVVPRESIR